MFRIGFPAMWLRLTQLGDTEMPAILMWLMGVPLIVIILLYLIF